MGGIFDVVANVVTGGGATLFGQNSDQQAQDGQYMGNPDLSQFGPNPYSSSLMDSINGMPKYQPLSAGSVTAPGSTYTDSGPYKGNAYTAKDMSQSKMPQYDAMRERLNTQYNQTQQQAQEANDRNFAAMGGGPGGSQIKATENLASSIAKQKGDDLLGVNAAEAEARQGLQNQENQKEFQSQETQKGYGFQYDQNAMARRQAASESAAGREMQAGEFNVGQQTQAEEFNKQMQQAQDQFKFQAGSTIAGLNTAWDQAQAESRNNEFNKVWAEFQGRHSGGFAGSGGFLGLGVGAGGFSI